MNARPTVISRFNSAIAFSLDFIGQSDALSVSIEFGRRVRIELPQRVGHQSPRRIQPITEIIEAFPRLCHGVAGLFNERADLCLLDRIRIIRIGDTDFDRVFIAAQPFRLLEEAILRDLEASGVRRLVYALRDCLQAFGLQILVPSCEFARIP